MKIYFDTCCWSRPLDDQTQERIRAEADAVKNIVNMAQTYGHCIFGSIALDREISAIKIPEKYVEVQNFYGRAVTTHAPAKKAVFSHFTPMAIQAGIRRMDTAHLCYSISAGVDYLITTDDDFIDIAAGLAIPVKVINPLNFPLGGVV